MFRRAQQRPVFPYRSPKTLRYLFASLLSALQLLTPSIQAFSTTLQTPPVRKVPTLEIGKPLERELSNNQAHTYQLTLLAGQYLRAVVYQKDIQVITTLFGADGKKI